ncbi:Undecaprenyl-diphosphatase [Halobacillus karajensis]|uniref:Undecaprenyl-diphosphatase n=1 Tax=Halobacillus karajensis TaxID=195088 RepID=A0A024P844_9BACI|nr:undecaprenyl-diphosphate phosphatase [Halobacillus karajensis]CDQ21040.1 Undecaprenyl-diphosphatase [Halobacillus karajensis]CDQ24896.1 Undecaprenyl-diphosphatase [Halobacillus karajensis]CDQ28744.1 Undecaprenyl-diphosphatase [Halobacillus karajensis]SEH97083.1 Undecaprenyl-diphosphatase [Halobacillus karajensis]
MEELWLLIKYLFLGIFQGFTEPIPISSSGHLVIMQELLGIKLEGLTFEVLVNFGSLVAVLIIYRNDLVRLATNGIGFLISRDARQKDDFDFIIYLIIGTIPAGVLGVLLGDAIEGLSTVQTVGITLIITGIALWLIRNLRGRKGDGQLTWKDAVIVGLGQAVALIPGISRSGATIVAAMFLGMKQETALRFSFLLFIPVSLGTMLLSVEDVIAHASAENAWFAYVLAFAGSVVASYFSLRWFMNVMARGNLKYFAFYCFIVGGLVVLFL